MNSSIDSSLTGEFSKSIWSKFRKGIEEYRLIESGDKIAVCISGGKDSMLMAKCIQRLKKYGNIDGWTCEDGSRLTPETVIDHDQVLTPIAE